MLTCLGGNAALERSATFVEPPGWRHNVARRRASFLPGYSTLSDVGMDGDFVTPLQIEACSATGPTLVAFNWSDAATARERREFLRDRGYLPCIPFNRVLNMALASLGLARRDTYMTQAFHLLTERRSSGVPFRDVRAPFEAVTRHELEGRRVVALGRAAARACATLGVDHVELPHPSARGRPFKDRAACIAEGIRRIL
ncbi:hypothetical protein SH611_18100 [Geminicoccaceae bacterium 1502E]|nr:hypothetical protein [Geminicoccaceae bacterium 1502E]